MKEIKLAFSHEEYPSAGTERMSAVLTEYLARNGYKIFMFVERVREDLLSESDRRNITFLPVGLGCDDSAEQIARELNRLEIDIFISPTEWQVDFSKLRPLTKAKLVFTNHLQGLQQIDDFFIVNRWRAKQSAGKFFEWFFMRMPHERITGQRRRGIIEKEKRAYDNCDLYTVICEEYKTQVAQLFNVAGERIVALPNWIEPREYGPMEKKNVVLYAGRLNYYQKRLDLLINIWALIERRFPDWELWLVGKGEERERLGAQVRRIGLRHVRFHDHVADPGDYYAQASILALTSVNEAWGLVISEAQQAGVVPIAFDCSAGVRVQLSPSGVNGVLVEPFDTVRFADELARLMSDGGRRREMSRNVIVKSREYSDPARLARWDEEFRKLLK